MLVMKRVKEKSRKRNTHMQLWRLDTSPLGQADQRRTLGVVNHNTTIPVKLKV